MAKVGTAEYDVVLSRSKVQAELDATSSTLEAGLGASAGKVEAEFSRSFQRIAKGAALLGAGVITKEAISAGSDLIEQQQKVNVVFGQSSDIVHGFANTSTEAFGVSRREAEATAGTFGNLFRTIGLGEGESAKMSTRLIGLAADLASFSNTDPSQALEALQSGLVGLTRPLRQYGINLDVASEKQKAMDLGLYSGKGNLTASARAQAAYALILEQSTLAQGDFARTSDHLAQQQKILRARFDDAKAALGQGLLPEASGAVLVFNDLLKVFGLLPSVGQQVVVGFGAIKIATALFGSQIAGAKVVGGNIAASFGFNPASEAALAKGEVQFAELTAARAADSLAAIQQVAASDALAASLLATGATIEEVTAAEEALAAAAGAAAAAEGAQAAAGAGIAASLGPITIALVAAYAAYKGLRNSFDGKLGSFKIPGLDPELLKGSNKELATAAERLNKINDLGANPFKGQDLKVLQAMRDALRETGQKSLPTLNAAIKDGELANARYESRTAKSAAADRDAAKAAQERHKAVEDLRTAVQADIDKQHDIFDAKEAEQVSSRDLASAIADEAKARRAAVGDSDEYRAAQADITRAEGQVAQAQKDSRDAQRDLTSAREEATRSLRDQRLENERAAISAERAALALGDAQDKLAQVQDDPRSTDREKEQAALDLRDAELSVQEAQNRRGDSAADLAKAEKAGIEGSDSVVAAKQRVADAAKAQGDAETAVATATKAAAKVLDDAKANVVTASDKVKAAVLREADTHEKIAGLLYGSAAGNDAYNASLLRSVAMLDPKSPFRTELTSYLADLTAIREVQDALNFHPLTPIDTGAGEAGTGGGHPLPAGAPTGTGLGLGGSFTSSLRGPTKTVNVGQINVTKSGASAKDIADELAFGRH
jgi:hypothetical protein